MLQPKKHYGQNFLEDERVLEEITNAIQITGHHIIEIGPGYGALTKWIIKKNPVSLTLVEIDPDMVVILEKRNQTEWKNSHITIRREDILGYTPPSNPYSIIANIPYYITTPIITYFLYDVKNSPVNMVLMMQKEVGEKILANRKKKRMSSYFSTLIEHRTENIWLVSNVPKTSFFPTPKVDSIVLGFTIRAERKRDMDRELFSLWSSAFAHPRKTFIANLITNKMYAREKLEKWLKGRGYDSLIRSERLTLEDWYDFEKQFCFQTKNSYTHEV